MRSPGSDVLHFALEPHAVTQIASDEMPLHLVRGQAVYQNGQPADALFRLHSGTCKTNALREDGHEQVTGYHLPGDVVGCGGMGSDKYQDEVVALEPCELRRLPYERLRRLVQEIVPLQRNVMCLLALEALRSLEAVTLLGTPKADRRIARFLLVLSQRHAACGQSAVDFHVQLSLTETASLLGLADETVSRALSRLQADGVLQKQGRRVELLDLPALRLRAGLAEGR